MENASKALIIAASVLIVILLIAFGIRIFRTTEGTGEQLDITMQTTEMAQFNGKFTGYAGSNKSAAQVKALANAVIASNSKNPATRQITFKGKTTANDIMAEVADYAGSYKVILEDSNSDGYIDTIKIN